MNFRKHIALLLIFALGFSIVRPCFVQIDAFKIHENASVGQKENWSPFHKVVWQLEDAQELEEDSKEVKIDVKHLSYHWYLFNAQILKHQFQHSKTALVRLFLSSKKYVSAFSRLYIVFENLRN